MKDITSVFKNIRVTAYPRKRPSLHGISKLRGWNDTPLLYSHPKIRKSPRNAKAERLTRKQREAQISALRHEGIHLEEEYRKEIRRYMHETEVWIPPFLFQKYRSNRSRFQQCTMRSAQSIGTCDLASPIPLSRSTSLRQDAFDHYQEFYPIGVGFGPDTGQEFFGGGFNLMRVLVDTTASGKYF